MIPKRRLLTLMFACLCFKKSLLIKIIIVIIKIIIVIIIIMILMIIIIPLCIYFY